MQLIFKKIAFFTKRQLRLIGYFAKKLSSMGGEPF